MSRKQIADAFGKPIEDELMYRSTTAFVFDHDFVPTGFRLLGNHPTVQRFPQHFARETEPDNVLQELKVRREQEQRQRLLRDEQASATGRAKRRAQQRSERGPGVAHL